MSRTSQDWQGAYDGHYPTMASAIYLGQEEFLRHALDVYKAAAKDMLPPVNERWLDLETGWSWNTAEGFYDAVLRRMEERLRRRAMLTGHLVESNVHDDDEEPTGAGRSPADEGHGWPAFALAGGPGCGAGYTSSAPDDALPYSPETRS